MTFTYPEIALPPDNAPGRPVADLIAYWLLKAHPLLTGIGDIEFADDPSARVSPWVRIGVSHYLEAPRPGESTPIVAVDVYADDALAASDNAELIARVWPYIKKVTIADEHAYVSGAWVEVEPYRLPEPDESSTGAKLARYHLEVGFRLHPDTQGA